MSDEDFDAPADGESGGALDGAPEEAAQQEKVGYQNPPIHTRFPNQKGTRGRKKGSKNLKTIAREAFETTVRVSIDGKYRRLTKKELAIHQLANQASKGNLRALEKAISFMERYLDDPVAEEPAPEVAKYHRAVLKNLIAFEKMFEEADDQDPGADHGC